MKTSRVKLIPLNNKDFELFKEINLNAFVRKYLWDDKLMSDEVFMRILNETDFRFKNERWGLWKITLIDRPVVIGYAGLWIFFDEHQPQLLYALRPEYIGQGYATESARLIIDYAFRELRFKELIATMDKENVDSIRMCERLAFTRTKERAVEGKRILFYRLENT